MLLIIYLKDELNNPYAILFFPYFEDVSFSENELNTFIENYIRYISSANRCNFNCIFSIKICYSFIGDNKNKNGANAFGKKE